METSALTAWVRRHWWVLVVLGVTTIGTFKRGPEPGYADPTAWAGVLAALAVVPLFWREKRPELTVVLNAAAASAYFAASPGFADGPIFLPVMLSSYAIASRRPVRRWLPYVGAAMAAVVVSLVVRELRIDASGTVGTVARLLWFCMVDSAAAALAVALRSRGETRTEQTRRAATEEQLRMAQDLHDGVGHGLAVIAMQAGVALHVLDRDPAAARRSLEAIRDTSRESLDALRAELVRLSPSSDDPAPRAPRNGLADLEVLADRVCAAGVQVRLDVDARPVSPDLDATAYVVVQEALTNVLRHAGASAADVTVRRTGETLDVAVTDDGRATSPASDPGPGLGIPGMRGRVEALGGTLAAGPRPGGGFEVRAVLPLETAGAESSSW